MKPYKKSYNEKKISNHFKIKVDDKQNKYSQTKKGRESLQRARKKYDEKDPEKRKEQKREYMRRKRLKDPSYCRWKK